MELGYFTLPAGEPLEGCNSVRVCGDIPELTPGLDVYQCVWEPTETGVVEAGALESVILISSVPAPTTLTLYHGSPVRDFTPTYGFGQDKQMVAAGGNDSVDGDIRLMEEVGANGVKTFCVDISGIRNVTIRIFDGFTCDAEVSNIYLS